jgi:hypothetical protein
MSTREDMVIASRMMGGMSYTGAIKDTTECSDILSNFIDKEKLQNPAVQIYHTMKELYGILRGFGCELEIMNKAECLIANVEVEELVDQPITHKQHLDQFPSVKPLGDI